MKKRFCIFALVVVMMFGTASCASTAAVNDGAVRLVCLNIGKADCMLLLYQDEAYLIDAGYSQTYAALAAMLAQYGVTRLNGVFLTHCHEDHEGGLMQLAQSDIAVDAWYAARIYYDVKAEKHPAVLAAAARKAQVTWLDAGNVINVGSDGAFTVLGPLTVNTENENNNSLVMRFSCGQGSILFAGDMKEEEEYELMDAGLLTACDVLKAGHHGDNNATSKALLKIVRPQAAVILTSTEEEPDTPATSTVRRLENVGCAVYVSQEYHDALLLTLKKGQKPTVTDVLWDGAPKRAENVALTINVEDDTLTIYNNGSSALSLSGYTLYSSRGESLLTLPDAAVEPGGSYVIGSKVTKGEYDYNWNTKRVWHQNRLDMAILYDAYGRAVARTDNGMPE